MALENSKSKDILTCCETIFAILRSHYKSKPKELVNVTSLATAVGLTPEKTVECLHYMFDASSIWQAHSTDFTDPNKAVVQPGERILKYKSFKEVVDQVLEWRKQRDTQYFARQVRGSPLDGIVDSNLHRVDATYQGHLGKGNRASIDRSGRCRDHRAHLVRNRVQIYPR